MRKQLSVSLCLTEICLLTISVQPGAEETGYMKVQLHYVLMLINDSLAECDMFLQFAANNRFMQITQKTSLPPHLLPSLPPSSFGTSQGIKRTQFLLRDTTDQEGETALNSPESRDTSADETKLKPPAPNKLLKVT